MACQLAQLVALVKVSEAMLSSLGWPCVEVIVHSKSFTVSFLFLFIWEGDDTGHFCICAHIKWNLGTENWQFRAVLDIRTRYSHHIRTWQRSRVSADCSGFVVRGDRHTRSQATGLNLIGSVYCACSQDNTAYRPCM